MIYVDTICIYMYKSQCVLYLFPQAERQMDLPWDDPHLGKGMTGSSLLVSFPRLGRWMSFQKIAFFWFQASFQGISDQLVVFEAKHRLIQIGKLSNYEFSASQSESNIWQQELAVIENISYHAICLGIWECTPKSFLETAVLSILHMSNQKQHN